MAAEAFATFTTLPSRGCHTLPGHKGPPHQTHLGRTWLDTVLTLRERPLPPSHILYPKPNTMSPLPKPPVLPSCPLCPIPFDLRRSNVSSQAPRDNAMNLGPF